MMKPCIILIKGGVIHGFRETAPDLVDVMCSLGDGPITVSSLVKELEKQSENKSESQYPPFLGGTCPPVFPQTLTDTKIKP